MSTLRPVDRRHDRRQRARSVVRPMWIDFGDDRYGTSGRTACTVGAKRLASNSEFPLGRPAPRADSAHCEYRRRNPLFAKASMEAERIVRGQFGRICWLDGEGEHGQAVKDVHADTVEDHQRNDARQIDGDPGAAVGARGPSMGESSTARSNDAPSGVAAICRAKPPPEEKPSKTNRAFGCCARTIFTKTDMSSSSSPG